MHKLVINSSFVLSILLNNTITFSMKRERNKENEHVTTTSSQQKIARWLKPGATVEMILRDLDKLYGASLPNLNIVNRLNQITHVNSNASAHEKILALRVFNDQKKISINKIQAQRRELILALPRDIAKQYITNEFEKIKLHFPIMKNNAQEELREAYAINAASFEWINYRAKACSRCQFNYILLQHPWDSTTWSAEAPKNFIECLVRKMKENRIEPTAFNVEILRDDLLPIANASCQGTQSKLVFIDESVSFIECIYNANKTRWSYRENQPGSIAFNPRIAHENDNFINHLVEHELTHAIAGDGKIAKSLVRFFVKNAHVTYDEVSRHLAYIKVILAQEIIADVRHALKSPYLAECAFDNTGYPETYGLLALITNNWDFLANIAKQETRVEKNVDNNVINKK